MTTNDKHIFIYGLYDPRDGLCHYIGQTLNPNQRRQNHFGIQADTLIAAWVMAIRAGGYEPEFEILATVKGQAQANELEERLIAEGFAAGLPLLNKRGAPGPKVSRQQRREAERQALVEAIRARDAARATERAKQVAHLATPEGQQERRLQALARVHARCIEIALLTEGK